MSELSIQNNGNHGLRISEASNVSLDDTEVSGNGEHGINITKASTLDARDTTIENNTKWGILSGYGAILDLGNVTIRGHQSGLHLVDKVSATLNNVTIENNQWTGANTGNTYDDNVFILVPPYTFRVVPRTLSKSTVRTGWTASLERCTICQSPISLSMAAPGWPCSPSGRMTTATSARTARSSAGVRGGPRLEELAEFTSKTHVRRPRSRRTRQ